MLNFIKSLFSKPLVAKGDIWDDIIIIEIPKGNFIGTNFLDNRNCALARTLKKRFNLSDTQLWVGGSTIDFYLNGEIIEYSFNDNLEILDCYKKPRNLMLTLTKR